MKISGKASDLLLFLCRSPNDGFSGYSMSKQLSIASGTLYPLLAKMEQAGLVEAEWEQEDPSELGRPRRRYYKITGEGVRKINERMEAINPAFQTTGGLGLA